MRRVLALLAAVIGFAGAAAQGVRDTIEPAAGMLDAILEEAGVEGAVLVRRLSDGAEWTGGGARVDERFLPASTFKIANTMILLEAGVITDPESEIIAWDGVERGGGWDQDQTLRSAFRRSAYWAYSRLAGEAGHGHMARMVTLLGYGDEHVGGPDEVGTFWLEGPLSVTAREQVGFLQRLHARVLPVEPAHMETVIGFMEVERGEDWVLRGKTGWGQPEGQPDIGWFVGWLESESDTWLFAVNIDMTDPERHRSLREHIARSALAAAGAPDTH
ncbi:penicillin-binding transpeptidase domain-containing protein [Marinicauda algicola]|uniref:penicillin-binding transpeptidase domain-containing protein n=1 Tax=Marinicauda algicola TaxID=2029849 RepID=UPI001305462E|nr:penicillin-binding transpeptidase domain-containing protein [Marinicauda algicola]